MNLCVRKQQDDSLTVLWWDQPVDREILNKIHQFMLHDLHKLSGRVAILKVMGVGQGVKDFGSRVTETDYVIQLDEFLYGTKT